MRVNSKNHIVTYEDSIKKSNKISMAKLSQNLTLNQVQLLAYAIFSTQQDGKTEFRKYEFQNKFGIKKYQTIHAKEDAQKLLGLQFSVEDLENDYFEYWNVFGSIKYKKGVFNFRWNEEFIPHILELKERYVTTDLTIASQFKSGFSWILYEYLKAHYGYWYKELSKEALMRLFGVEDRKTYQKNTSDFKKMVLDVAIDELTKLTELEIWYTEIKKGRAIVGFKLHWSTGEKVYAATEKQVTLLREIRDEVERNMFDYFSLKDAQDLEQARHHIIAVKEIDNKINKGLSSKEASEVIHEAKHNYLMLESLIENDGKERDTSFYYNWLEDVDD